MKLSSKFFIIAYTVVLLATGFGGMFIVRSVTKALISTREEQALAASQYAADSLCAFADMASDELTAARLEDIARQIKFSLGDIASEVKIHNIDSVPDHYKKLKTNEGLSRYIERDGTLIFESVCRIFCYNDNLYLSVRSDFTETEAQCDLIRNSYTIVVFAVSAAGGLILFLLSKKITRSLNRLTEKANEVANGNYGQKVLIPSSDRELSNLAESFNTMSTAIEQKIHQIEQEGERRERFVADFAHELKTPMTAIMGYSQMLRSYEMSESETKEAAHAIHSEAKRLENLARQMLDLYVYKNEKIELSPLSIPALCDQLNITLYPLSQKHNVSLNIKPYEATVFANETLLLSLIYNLADNAFKASSAGDTVFIGFTDLGNELLVFIKDTGRGISTENIKLLTEPFFREDKSRSRAQGGAGLGLSLCKEIVRLHGSELYIESQKGAGTTVSFRLKKGGESNDHR